MEQLSIWHWLIVAALVFVSFGGHRMFSRKSMRPSNSLNTSWALGVVGRGRADTITRAETLRNELKKRLVEGAPAHISFTTYESNPGHGTVWLRIEFVKRSEQRADLSLRTVLTLTIERMDFHRFEHVLTLELGRGHYRRKVTGLVELRDDDIRSLLRFAAGDEVQFPWLQSRRQRERGWQVWRAKNRVVGVRHDWASIGTNIIGIATLMYGGIGLYGALSDDGVPNGVTAEAGLLLLLTGLAILIVGNRVLRRRVTLFLNSGKPLADPAR